MMNGNSASGFKGMFDSSDDETSAKRMRPAGSATGQWRDAIVKDAIRAALGEKQLSSTVRKHVVAETEVLAAKTNRTLSLLDKQERVNRQAADLAAGSIPTGVKPFKCAVDIPELDTQIGDVFLNLSLANDASCTYRQLKEKIHFFAIAAIKRVDAAVMDIQISNLQKEIARDAYVKRITQTVTSKADDVDALMGRLGLSKFGEPKDELAVSVKNAEELYHTVMRRIASDRRKVTETDKKKKEGITKQIEKLKDSKPEELLKLTVARSVDEALSQYCVKQTKGKGGSKGGKGKGSAPNPSNIDWSQAYTLSVTNPNTIGEAVYDKPLGTAPAHQKKWKSSEAGSQVFRGAKKQKGKGSTKEQPKGKGHGHKGTGKGKGKSKAKGAAKGKSHKGTRKGAKKGGK